jgi:hypothetical protein
MIAEFHPATDSVRDAACRSLWEDFSKKQGSLPEDVRAFMPILYTGFFNREYALDIGSDLAALGIPIEDIGERISRDGEALRIRDAFGSIRGMVGVYLEVIEPAVKSIEDLVELRLPDVSAEKPYQAIRKFRAEHPEACLYGESFGAQDLPSTQIWEMSQFMLALYDYPDQVKRFQERFNERMIAMSRKMVAAGADIILIYDDYGTQWRCGRSSPIPI